jgi:FMN phosphatase YigB (HAD superfamily)
MKPTAIIFDVDGTLANIEPYLHHIRNLDNVDNFKKDFDKFHEESVNARPNMEVVQMVNHAVADGHAILVVTSRKEMWRPHTSMWLAVNDIRSHALFMRSNNDDRKDYDVKRDILKKINSMWIVVHAVDDNPAVIRLWEENNIPTTKIGNWDGDTN